MASAFNKGGRPKLPGNNSEVHTKIRHVRVPEDDWAEAAAKAKQDGRTISEVVRILLARYRSGEIEL